MQKLAETWLQKIILLIGGLSILIRLFDVNYYQTYPAILQALGIAIITFVLLVLTKDYKPEIHRKTWRILKRFWYIFALAILILLAWYVGVAYLRYATAEQFHKSEIAYQNCLDKIANLSIFTPTSTTITFGNFSETLNTQKETNPYFNEWETAGRPGYNSNEHWEWGFMQWMMQTHPDFCSEFNTSTINSFVTQELSSVNE
jgi:hypothetical protein